MILPKKRYLVWCEVYDSDGNSLSDNPVFDFWTRKGAFDEAVRMQGYANLANSIKDFGRYQRWYIRKDEA